jgi:hypothetical protein
VVAVVDRGSVGVTTWNAQRFLRLAGEPYRW